MSLVLLIELCPSILLTTAISIPALSSNEEVGVIAEELSKAGFPEFVIYDQRGRTPSIAYERIWLVIASAFGQVIDRLDRVEQHIGLSSRA